MMEDRYECVAPEDCFFSSEDTDEKYAPGRFVVTSHTPPHTPDGTSDALSPVSGARSPYSPSLESVSS